MLTPRAEQRSILGWTGQVLAWFVIAGVLVLLTLYSVPYLGRLNNALSGGERAIAVYVVGVGLVLYAAMMFMAAARDRRRGRQPDPAEVSS